VANSEKSASLTREDVTGLLQAWSQGDSAAPEKLAPVIYAELRRLARRALRGEHAQQPCVELLDLQRRDGVAHQVLVPLHLVPQRLQRVARSLGAVQPHFDVSDRSEINNALATNADASQAVSCPLAPGDASFHHCRTLHFTGGNTSDTPRHGLITHFFPAVRAE